MHGCGGRTPARVVTTGFDQLCLAGWMVFTEIIQTSKVPPTMLHEASS